MELGVGDWAGGGGGDSRPNLSVYCSRYLKLKDSRYDFPSRLPTGMADGRCCSYHQLQCLSATFPLHS